VPLDFPGLRNLESLRPRTLLRKWPLTNLENNNIAQAQQTSADLKNTKKPAAEGIFLAKLELRNPKQIERLAKPYRALGPSRFIKPGRSLAMNPPPPVQTKMPEPKQQCLNSDKIITLFNSFLFKCPVLPAPQPLHRIDQGRPRDQIGHDLG
jgi:hypothetical protein